MHKLPLDRATWPLIALLASAAMLGVAYAFEYLLYLAPCPLCITQRHVYWASGALALVAVALNWRGVDGKLMIGLSVLLGVIFLIGCGFASYHSLVEWGILPAPVTCAATGPMNTEGNLSDILSRPIAVPSCKDAMWRDPVLQLSMAGWNAIVSLILAGASFFAATRPMRTDTANETGEPLGDTP